MAASVLAMIFSVGIDLGVMAKFLPLANIEVWLSDSLCSDRFITVQEEMGNEVSGDRRNSS